MARAQGIPSARAAAFFRSMFDAPAAPEHQTSQVRRACDRPRQSSRRMPDHRRPPRGRRFAEGVHAIAIASVAA